MRRTGTVFLLSALLNPMVPLAQARTTATSSTAATQITETVELDPERAEAALQLRQLITELKPTGTGNQEFHESYVPRSAISHESAGATQPYRPPERRWPAEIEQKVAARNGKPDRKLELWNQLPSATERMNRNQKALQAPGERGGPAAAESLERQFERVAGSTRGIGSDVWQGTAYGTEQNLPNRYYSGRATQVGIHYDPLQDRTVTFAGTLGGLYKVVFVGIFAFWVPISADLPGAPSVGAFVVRPSNGLEILIGTGDFARAGGDGIYKSNDGGATWRRSPITPISGAVYRMQVDVSDDSVVMAATSRGVFRSTNFGNSWTRITFTDTTDVLQDTTFPSFWYAAQRSLGVLESSDSGASFHQFSSPCTGIPGTIGRTELTLSPSAVNHVFAVVETGGALNGIYRSSDYGCNWTSIDSLDTNSWGQAFHAMAIEVDPGNPNRLFVGMGGGQWTSQALAASPCWYRNAGGTSDCGLTETFDAGHVDMTDFLFNGGRVFITGDGGIFSYNFSTHNVTDGGNALGFNTLQVLSSLQSLTTSQLDNDFLLSGLQDNGIITIRSGQSDLLSGGDGGIMSISPDDDDELYPSVGLGFRRLGSFNGGSSFFSLNCGLEGRGFHGVYKEPTPSVFPSYIFTLAPDPVTDDEYLWYKPASTTCDWAKVNTNPLPFTPVAVTQNNDPARWTLYVWSWAERQVLVMDSGVPGSMTWVDRTPPGLNPPPPGRRDMRLFADSSGSRPGTAYYTTGTAGPNQAFVTHNRGVSWNDVTGNLQALTGGAPLHEMVGDPQDTDTLFIATHVGVFRTDTANAPVTHWYRYMAGLPAVMLAYNLEVTVDDAGDSIIRLGSYGSGFWERKVADTGVLFADGFESGDTTVWSLP